jgi:hypothetical protein
MMKTTTHSTSRDVRNIAAPVPSPTRLALRVLFVLLFAASATGCGGEDESTSEDCDQQEAEERCDRCLDSCGPGCDPLSACEVSCSGC